MLTVENIKQLINRCRLISILGLNGISVNIPELKIDILKPPHDFVGVGGNPAIFINQYTYRLLGKKHKNWVVNETIAMKAILLNKPAIEVIGAIVHEVGHAFNVAAKIPNTEANAYIFEIEVMCKLFETKYHLLGKCTSADAEAYFKSRLSYYKMEINDTTLAKLVAGLKCEFDLEPAPPLQKQNPNHLPNLFFPEKFSFFARKHWKAECELIRLKMDSHLPRIVVN
ncbi:Uncharacterised protein [Legionella lansingensis]|uniref:Uncharacterized protein n=1 Tax=Legionella lansingensis TaxID=45067 RepID=A0A0W0VK14_9GAMM|nr:hypothetical protein [Legionella lansingensis]KTD20436.1 hypothetical protein Llan_1860 [Legionella lansingensis]SNV49971.1 Uncharacterised protein [Legionella lansingensis]